MGAGKSKGFGKIAAKTTKIQLTYFGTLDPCADGRVRGTYELTKEAKERRKYGLAPVSEPPSVATSAVAGSTLWRHERTVSEPANFWNSMKPYFVASTWNDFRTLAGRASDQEEVQSNVGHP